jgi:predicted XRE-type DNA-binding protein
MEDNMEEFNLIQYIEEKRMEKGIKQNKAAELIGCSESNYSNKVYRKSFSFEEILKLCNMLNINLNDVRDMILLNKTDIDEMIENLSYSGNNNYTRNARGFIQVEEILNNKVILDTLDKAKKFELGYRMVCVAPNHNGYGIREAETYFNILFARNLKIDLDFASGMLYGCFFNMTNNYSITFWPKYRYFPNMIEHILKTYIEDEIIYMFKSVDEKTSVTRNINVFIPEEFNVVRKYLSEDYYVTKESQKINIIINIIRKILELAPASIIVEYEINKFILKLEYISKIYFTYK